jgi:hypothetical protein
MDTVQNFLMDMGSTKLLTEVSSWNLAGGKGRPTAIWVIDFLEHVEASMSHSYRDGLLFLFFFLFFFLS